MNPVVLLGLNARYSHSNPALYSLRTAAGPVCPDIRIMEYSINADPAAIVDHVLSVEPSVLALSVYIWNAEISGLILKAMRELAPGIPVAAGGPEVTHNASRWLELYPPLRWVIAGPGETAFRKLAEGGFSAPGGVLREPNPPFRELPFPYVPDDFPTLRGRYVYYESSRGCPFRCAYCLSSRDDAAVEFREVEQVKAELDILAARGFPAVKFVDRTFNVRPSHSRAIWRHIIDSYGEGETTFHFEIMASRLEEEDFEILDSSPGGLIQLEAGVQSVHPVTLELIGRKDDPGKAIRAIGRLSSMENVHVHGDLLVGLPGEDMNHVRESFNALYMARPDHLQLGFLKVLHGTVMREKAAEWGIRYSVNPPFEVLETDHMGPDEPALLHEMADLLDTLYCESRFRETLALLEGLYPSPFDLFQALARHRLSSAREGKTRSWEKNASFLLGYCERMHPSLLPETRDALRWDWCLLGRSHRYPPFLAGEITRTARKIGCGQQEGSDPGGYIFFMAESDRFKKLTGGTVKSFPLHVKTGR